MRKCLGEMGFVGEFDNESEDLGLQRRTGTRDVTSHRNLLLLQSSVETPTTVSSANGRIRLHLYQRYLLNK